MKYHLVGITRYRKPVLRGSITGRVRNLIREICKARDVEILKGHVWAEQVHIVVSVPPHSSLSQLVQWIKGKTSRKMLARSGVGIGFCPTGEGS